MCDVLTFLLKSLEETKSERIGRLEWDVLSAVSVIARFCFWALFDFTVCC